MRLSVYKEDAFLTDVIVVFRPEDWPARLQILFGLLYTHLEDTLFIYFFLIFFSGHAKKDGWKEATKRLTGK